MTGRHSTDLLLAGAGRPTPLFDLSCSRRQSRLPDPQKKKKKKSGKKQRRGWCGSGNYTRAVRWRLCERGGTEEGIVEHAGQRVYTIGASLVASGE